MVELWYRRTSTRNTVSSKKHALVPTSSSAFWARENLMPRPDIEGGPYCAHLLRFIPSTCVHLKLGRSRQPRCTGVRLQWITCTRHRTWRMLQYTYLSCTEKRAAGAAPRDLQMTLKRCKFCCTGIPSTHTKWRDSSDATWIRTRGASTCSATGI